MSRLKFFRIAQVLTLSSARVLRVASSFNFRTYFQCSLFRRELTVSHAHLHISESFAERCKICPSPSNRHTVDCDFLLFFGCHHCYFHPSHSCHLVLPPKSDFHLVAVVWLLTSETKCDSVTNLSCYVLDTGRFIHSFIH